jgi:hypothetical protein
MAKKKKLDFDVLEEGYTSYRVKIDQVKLNPMNPRTIEDDRFRILVQSIKDEPHILKIRPIVVNGDMIALGGNQRLKACREAGFESVWILNADDIDDKEQRSFIIADNADFGKWDEEILKKAGYEPLELRRLGVEAIDIVTRESQELPSSGRDTLPSEDIVEPDVDESDLEKRYETYQNNTIKQIVLYYPNDLYEKVCQTLDVISKELDCDDNSEVVLRLLNFWEFNNGKPPSDFHTDEGESREDENDEDA